jgi:hypothetical protein
MNAPLLLRNSQEREFFAHHMLLHASELALAEAESSQVGRFNKCLSAMVMTALSIEALANAVGSRAVTDWPTFERMRPLEKLDLLVTELEIRRDESSDPWPTLVYLAGFRNDIAHAKPEPVKRTRELPEAALAKRLFDAPRSRLEREVTLGNAKRCHGAVHLLKGILTDALPDNKRFGIYADMWSESTGLAE